MQQDFRPLTRPLTREDAPLVIGLMEASLRANLAPMGSHWTPEQLTTECAEQLSWGIFEGDQKLQAFVLARELGAAWEISLLATDPDERGRGLMRRLLAHLVSFLPAGHELWLEVHEANVPARRLYVAVGFQEVGRRPKYYADGAAAILYNYGPR